MRKILDTKQLEFDKSTFLIDLVRHDTGSVYIEILQRIHTDKSQAQVIKINPSILMDIVRVLIEFHEQVPQKQIEGFLYFTEDEKKNLQDRYLKGISTKDLALQFDTSEGIIEMILRNRGIVVMKDIKPINKRKWRRNI